MEQNLKISNRSEKTEIELWDCSGDLKYESCWAALSEESNGVIFVYNPKDPDQAKELNQWYTHFVQQYGVREECCMVIVNRFDSEYTSNTKGESNRLSNLFDNIKTIQSNMDEESEKFRNEFKNFLQKVADFSKSKQDQEEKLILR
jgi:Rab-like protein 5